MKSDIIQSLSHTFETHSRQTEGGVEFWFARDVQDLLGYSKWDNFLNVVSKAKTACEGSGLRVADHFADVGKMVGLGSGSQREVDDLMLTRYACYLIAQNGDPRKQEIAFAQTYFAITNHQAVRQTLLDRGIRPESLPPAEDVKKVERRLASEDKKSLKNPESLDP